MKFKEQFTPTTEQLEIIVGFLTNSEDEGGQVSPVKLTEAQILEKLRYTIGFTIEDSQVEMIITYRTSYVNQLNFRLETVAFVVYGFEIFPLSMFIYPDGSISEQLFNDTETYLKQYFPHD
ncbi:hypothetical protein LV89_04919 [Arcicella aurantiaca]|uniref:Uncharacterized protein n=1 Tax=Arcicella aurantiaca TaxID=591202 RepID=A0A316DDL1_9BACT|nr:hypothetical protein [Arcicella aurantiaca]PWK16104.1 hypothetical protein LV89_04919 [Arcicella aurantiaca]